MCAPRHTCVPVATPSKYVCPLAHMILRSIQVENLYAPRHTLQGAQHMSISVFNTKFSPRPQRSSHDFLNFSDHDLHYLHCLQLPTISTFFNFPWSPLPLTCMLLQLLLHKIICLRVTRGGCLKISYNKGVILMLKLLQLFKMLLLSHVLWCMLLLWLEMRSIILHLLQWMLCPLLMMKFIVLLLHRLKL